MLFSRNSHHLGSVLLMIALVVGLLSVLFLADCLPEVGELDASAPDSSQQRL